MADVTKADIKDIYDAINDQRIAISSQAVALMRIETLLGERRTWCGDCQKDNVKTHLEEVKNDRRTIRDTVLAYIVQGIISCCFMGAALLIYNQLKGG